MISILIPLGLKHPLWFYSFEIVDTCSMHQHMFNSSKLSLSNLKRSLFFIGCNVVYMIIKSCLLTSFWLNFSIYFLILSLLFCMLLTELSENPQIWLCIYSYSSWWFIFIYLKFLMFPYNLELLYILGILKLIIV